MILHADQAKGGSGEPPKTFTFDQVYDDTSQQEVTRARTAPALLSRDRTRERGCRTRSARCALRAAQHAALYAALHAACGPPAGRSSTKRQRRASSTRYWLQGFNPSPSPRPNRGLGFNPSPSPRPNLSPSRLGTRWASTLAHALGRTATLTLTSLLGLCS